VLYAAEMDDVREEELQLVEREPELEQVQVLERVLGQELEQR
jgi:hypothetical protein